jgi:AcrR family transcriptional regulator
MVRQARSETTRRKIIDVAVELFSTQGYAATGLGDIVERLDMTKGALYYHFESKEALADTIIAEGAGAITSALRNIFSSPAPAMENLIHGIFVAADLAHDGPIARTATQLARSLGEFSDAASAAYGAVLRELSAEAARAQAQGDVRADVDPDAVAELVFSSTAGAELLSRATTGGSDMAARLTRIWELLLPAIATDHALEYFREYLARESIRHVQPTLVL